MLNSRIIIGAVLVLAVAFQTGCSGKDTPKNPDSSEAIKQETKENSTVKQEDKQKTLMDEFNSLAVKDTKPAEAVGFINKNIPFLSNDNASIVVNKLEEIQKKKLPQLEEKFNGDKVQSEMSKVYKPGFDISKIDNIADKELKDLLLETRAGWYKVETAEGTYFPVIDYEAYKKYSSYAAPDIKAYIDIMSVESGKVPAKDAALVIGWDEVLKRALNQEKFISQYPESVKINDVKQLYKKYISFVVFGTNNTPLFSYDSKTMADGAKSVYLKAVAGNENSKLLETLRMYLEVLKKGNYRLTEEVEKFRKSAYENML